MEMKEREYRPDELSVKMVQIRPRIHQERPVQFHHSRCRDALAPEMDPA